MYDLAANVIVNVKVNEIASIVNEIAGAGSGPSGGHTQTRHIL